MVIRPWWNLKKTAIVAESSSSASRLQDQPSLHPHIIIITYIYNALNDALSASRIHNKLKTIPSKYVHILNRQS